MIKLVDIALIYNAGKPNEFEALRGISTCLETGHLTVIKGASGSGKSSLLSILGCMRRPTTGRIWLREREITSLPERFRTRVRRETFGFVFQHIHLIRGISVLENVMLPAYPAGLPIRELRAKAHRLLEQFEIGNKAGRKVEELSGGERQRAAIARALVNDPDVVIADEPTAHLDSELSREVIGLLAGLTAQEKTVIIASHDPLVIETQPGSRVIELYDGRMREDGH